MMIKLKIALVILYVAMVAHALPALTDERVHLSALSKPSDIEAIVLSDFPLGTKKRVVLEQIHKKYVVYETRLLDQNGFPIRNYGTIRDSVKKLRLILDIYVVGSFHEPLLKELGLLLEFDDTDSLVNVDVVVHLVGP